MATAFDKASLPAAKVAAKKGDTERAPQVSKRLAASNTDWCPHLAGQAHLERPWVCCEAADMAHAVTEGRG